MLLALSCIFKIQFHNSTCLPVMQKREVDGGARDQKNQFWVNSGSPRKIGTKICPRKIALRRNWPWGSATKGGIPLWDDAILAIRVAIKFGNLHLEIWKINLATFRILTNIFCNFDKYILQFGQIYFVILTNIFYNLDKYILQFGKILVEILTNIYMFQENWP